ncbi:SusC/RagA family TonB-linked outer membrane protein [Paraflavitalea sp. CAU 1676]|uniref:SusC/RagA family TonB-linked outer membrane protein n=1 Tax=Paraflavitalea sp. CAU 1676 TaxID=3032598 RepID=UPI0023DBC90A|nr:SusC/RagA family TonB-linked outer membrane protein [Paraflavitalea sp. CAU 1676]MDF2187937.1 SusC/RagA family TonB-linked outer membrane protein [Paraflavitalea sp. CAU 1676]
MRVNIALLTTLLLLLSLDNYAQKITIVQKGVALGKVFSLIQQQSGLSLFYDSRLFKDDKKIDIDVKDASVETVMDHCLKDLPFTYVITDNIIVIKEKVVAPPAETKYLLTISGTIRGKDSVALPGATVMLKEIKRAAQTDGDGQFTIEHVPPGSYTVLISFVGYESIQRPISVSERTPAIVVTLPKTEDRLDEITVTALGLTRKTRSLTYATQKVSGEEFSTVKNTNILNSLNGKVSGVQVNRTTGGPGGSVRIVLRGDKSTRNSQPLYVLDGLPIVNPTGGPVAGLYNDAPDAGDIISAINPDDIESVSILKGAAASALYGSQGSNGVVLISTRGGNPGAARINFSSSVTAEQPIVFPQTQFNYKQSAVGDASSPGSEDSWGDAGATTPNRDYVKDFFQTGITFINGINITGGTAKSSQYVSYSNTRNKGILPTSDFKQHTLCFRQTGKFLNDKLVFDGSFLGSIQNAHNRLTPGIYYNPLTGLYLMPRGFDFNDFKQFEYLSPSRYLYAQNWWNINYEKDQANGGGWGGQDYQQNPYWVMNRNVVKTRNQHAWLSASLKYYFNSALTLQVRGYVNHFVNEYERNIYATTQATLSRVNGVLHTIETANTTAYGDLLLSGSKNLSADWDLNFTGGASLQHHQGTMLSIAGSPTVPNVFLESALDKATIDIRNFNEKTNSPARKEVQSIFGTVQVSYRNKLFLDLSNRNDWSSTLANTPSEKSGYNYFSAGAAVALHEMFTLPAVLDYLRVRASYAVVGNDIAAFSSYPLYTFTQGNATPPGSAPVQLLPGHALKPETNRSLEIGLQWKTRENKVQLDASWYKSNIEHQYFKGVALPPGIGSGGYADINSGNIRNMGIEGSLRINIVQRKGFEWNTIINVSHNSNKVIELFDPAIVPSNSPNQLYRLQGGTGGYDGILKQGGSYGDFYGSGYQRDAQGRIIMNTVSGLPLVADDLYLGNPNPKVIVGWQNSFTIKNCTFSFLIDGKFGGRVLSIAEAYMDQLGISKRTGEVRDNGGQVYLKDAVSESGQPYKGGIDAETYYKYIGGKTPLAEAYMYDATAIRLRELSVAYRLPLRNKKIGDIRLGLIGCNLFFLKRNAPFDPEQVAGVNPGGVGVDVFGLPAYRSFGMSLQYTL